MIDRIREPTRATLALFLLLAGGGLGGCGNLTSGGVGEVDLYAAGDDPAAAGSSPTAPRMAPQQSAPIEGTLSLQIRSYIQSEGGDWIELTDGPTEVTVDLQGAQQSRIAGRAVTAGGYRRVRSVFGRVHAQVERGLLVDGEPVVGEVRVRLGNGDMITVEEPLVFELADGEAASLLLDLNAQLWLRLVDRIERRVATRDFSDVVRTRVR